jgi:lysyl-tRNA synthetase class II
MHGYQVVPGIQRFSKFSYIVELIDKKKYAASTFIIDHPEIMSPVAKWHRSKAGLAISISIYLHVHFILAISYNLLFFWLQEVILFPAMKPQD